MHTTTRPSLPFIRGNVPEEHPTVAACKYTPSKMSANRPFEVIIIDVNSLPLRLSVFKDISAFVLNQLKSYETSLAIHYVKNADEAHSDLKEQRVDLVLMSYDDTLSIAIEERYPEIVAVMPVHGGILDLCGRIEIDAEGVMSNMPRIVTTIGIDTDTGYARALRQYLKKTYSPKQYESLRMTYAGATNLRFERLLDGEIDATLLNPPFSYSKKVHRWHRLFDTFGAYQGVVVNTNRSWLARSGNLERLRRFSDSYYATVQSIRNNPAGSIQKLQAFYGISPETAAATFARLWHEDGLALSPRFNQEALRATQRIFALDSGLSVESLQDFIATLDSPLP